MTTNGEAQASGMLVAVGRNGHGSRDAIAAFVRTCGCTIDDAETKTLGAFFAILLRFCGDIESVQRVKNEAKSGGESRALDILLYDDVPEYAPPDHTLLYHLRIDAIDRMGIIDELTTVLTNENVMILELKSNIAERPFRDTPHFAVMALLRIPAANVSKVLSSLDTLNLDYVLTPRDS